MIDRKTTVSVLYAEMGLVLHRLAEIHKALSASYRIDSIAHTEHKLSAKSAERVAVYWAASYTNHLPDLVE